MKKKSILSSMIVLLSTLFLLIFSLPEDSEKEAFYFESNNKMYRACLSNNLVIDKLNFEEDEEEEVDLSNELTKENLNNEIAEISERYGADGVSVAVIENGVLQDTYQYGHAVKPNIRMAENSKIRIASVSKVVLSMIALRMEEQGYLDLFASIGDYWGFPITNPYYPNQNISLFSIFTHTSSITDQESYGNIEGSLRSSNIFNKTRPSDPMTSSYCNYAFAVAGATLEKAANKIIHDLANDTFFSALGIDASFISGKVNDTFHLAELYYTDGSIARSHSSLSNYNGNDAPGKNGNTVVGSLYISAKDMATLVAILANDGIYNGKQYLKKESIEMMETPYCTTDFHGTAVTQCMPLKYNENIYNQKGLYFHTGSGYGVYSLISYNPFTKNGVVVISTGASGNQDTFGIYSVCGEISNTIYDSLDTKRALFNEDRRLITKALVNQLRARYPSCP